MVDPALLSSEPFWFPYRGKFEHVTGIFGALLQGKLVRSVVGLVRMRLAGD